MGITLVVNPGSSSKKYALYENRKVVLEFRYELTSSGFEVCTTAKGNVQNCRALTQEEYQVSFSQVALEVKKYLEEQGKILDAICVRIVSPGRAFQKHQLIDDFFVRELRRHELSVPLHVPVTLQEIQFARQKFPNVKLVAASDSAFHATMPERARNFSIDSSDADAYDIYRFGYHGLSVASVIRRVHPLTGLNPEKIIVCHVGGGVSVTAVKQNKSIDTTMGYAPTSGLPMGSRVGDIDAGALLQLMRAKNLKPSEAEIYIHTKGGLEGLGGDSDIRRLLDRTSKDDAVARRALEHFIYHIQKAIGAAVTALGGVDMIVLTGTACSRSAELRTMILKNFEYLDVGIDTDRNEALVGLDGVFSVQHSKVKLVAVRTDEMGEMATIAEQSDLPAFGQ